MTPANEVHDAVTPREFELCQKLHEATTSTIHLRIAALEENAQRDRETQAGVNKTVDDKLSKLAATTSDNFRDVKLSLVVLGIGVALTLMANLPGLFAVLKGIK